MRPPQRPESPSVTAPTDGARGAGTSHMPGSSDVIVRRRLLGILSQGVRGPLTLVTAPAGYGKTVLARSWAAQEGASYAIVNTTLDDDAASLWTSGRPCSRACRMLESMSRGCTAPAPPLPPTE